MYVQSWHAIAPADEEYVPDGQLWHTDCAVLPAYAPAPHWLHAFFACGKKFSMSNKQNKISSYACADAYCPWSHASHSPVALLYPYP